MMKKKTPTALDVAMAICKASKLAGQRFDVDDEQPIETRAANLLRDGTYGPYIREGDPHEWGGPGVVATIYLEQKGGDGDCIVPMDYYDGGFDVAYKASEILDGFYIEFVNAAVACVYPVA